MSSDLILKLRTESQSMRVRVESEKIQDMLPIKEIIEESWPQLKGTQYRVYYIDEYNEMCLLNDMSVGDAMASVKEQQQSSSSTPILELYIQSEGEEMPVVASDDVADTLAHVLDDMDYVDGLDAAERFVDSLVAADSDLGAILDQLQTTQNAIASDAKSTSKAAKKEQSVVAKQSSGASKTQNKPVNTVEASGYKQVGNEAPKQFHVERQVSSGKEACDMMVDLLTQMGFVNNKKDAKKVVDELVSSPDDMQRVTDRIEDLVDGKEPTIDDAAQRFVNMLDDSGMVRDRDAAEALVGAMRDAEQDIDEVFRNFSEKTNSKEGKKALKSDKTSA